MSFIIDSKVIIKQYGSTGRDRPKNDARPKNCCPEKATYKHIT